MQICQHFKNTMDFFLFLLHKKHVIWYCLLQSGWVWILTTTVSCCGYFLVQIIGPCHQVEKISFTQTKLSCVGKYSTFSIPFVFRVIAWNISVLLTGLCVVWLWLCNVLYSLLGLSKIHAEFSQALESLGLHFLSVQCQSL